jgi:hypothetical protein
MYLFLSFVFRSTGSLAMEGWQVSNELGGDSCEPPQKRAKTSAVWDELFVAFWYFSKLCCFRVKTLRGNEGLQVAPTVFTLELN